MEIGLFFAFVSCMQKPSNFYKSKIVAYKRGGSKPPSIDLLPISIHCPVDNDNCLDIYLQIFCPTNLQGVDDIHYRDR